MSLPQHVRRCTTSAVAEHFAQRMAALRVARSTPVAVALSGGPDSLALAALTAWWSGACAALVSAALDVSCAPV